MSQPVTLQSPLLSQIAGVRHAFFTRQGGVSKGVYDSLNVGVGSKDDPEAVQENRARAAAALGVELTHLLTCYQIHSSVAVPAKGPWPARPEADGVVTGAANLACGALSADCAPILLADGEARVVGAAHAGWKGALGGV
ncbi:MAG: polyphenol oxidase, partial [Caulobacteraceae bacterium]|nr:polyphenol oxidase [Caulobacteraceae bacterium]